MKHSSGLCENCKKMNECKKIVGVIWGFCNTDFEAKDEVNENDNNSNENDNNSN